MKAADLVWLATARLQVERTERSGFTPEEILKKVLEMEPDNGFSQNTLRTHISRHCVANLPPAGPPHRMLTRNPGGTYRLYRSTDEFHPARAHGKTCPEAEAIPAKYKDLVDWFHREYDRRPEPATAEDPLLVLRGLGKEVWKKLGGGERFIRDLRANWYGSEEDRTRTKAQLRRKRRAG